MQVAQDQSDCAKHCVQSAQVGLLSLISHCRIHVQPHASTVLHFDHDPDLVAAGASWHRVRCRAWQADLHASGIFVATHDWLHLSMFFEPVCSVQYSHCVRRLAVSLLAQLGIKPLPILVGRIAGRSITDCWTGYQTDTDQGKTSALIVLFFSDRF